MPIFSEDQACQPEDPGRQVLAIQPCCGLNSRLEMVSMWPVKIACVKDLVATRQEGQHSAGRDSLPPQQTLPS